MSRRRGKTRSTRSKQISDYNEIYDSVDEKLLSSMESINATAKRVLRSKEDINQDEYSNTLMNDDLDYLVVNNNDTEITEEDQLYEDLVDDKTQGTKVKRRKVNKKKAVSKTKNGSMQLTQNKNTRIIRGFKDLTSQRAKLERLFGSNEEKLLNLAKTKEAFELSAFTFDIENVQEDSKYYLDYKPLCCVEDNNSVNLYNSIILNLNKENSYLNLSEDDFLQRFKSSTKKLGLTIGETEYYLQTNDKIEFPVFSNDTRKGFVYNLGGLVTDIAWLTNENINSTTQYLAVSVSQYGKHPSINNLKLFGKQSHYSCIQIFCLDTETLQFDKVQTIVHKFGETWNLRWHEGCNTLDFDGYIGLLGFSCQDGSVNFIDILKGGNTIKEIETPSLNISLPEYQITCFDFLSSTRIICGFNSGHVSEFDLTEPDRPFYFTKISESYVVSISVAYSDVENPVVSTISIDGYLHIFDPDDIFSSKCSLNRFKGDVSLSLTYAPHLYAYVYSDSGNNTKVVIPKAQFPLQVSSFDSNATAFGSSRLHPLILSAGSDGTVQIDNLARKVFESFKKVNSYKTLKLWKWDYSNNDDLYRLDNFYAVKKMVSNEVSNYNLNPHGIHITAIKWNENRSSAKFYAFANAAGFLTIEHLG